METFMCKYCYKTFPKKAKNQKYCSADCKKRYYAEIFYQKPRRKKKKKETNLRWYNNHKDEYNAKRRKSKIKKVCDHCGEEFETALDTQRFCSARCRSRYWHENEFKSRIKILEKAKNKVTKKRAVNARKPWTEEEDNKLLELAETMTYLEIALELGRSKASISYRLMKVRKEIKEKEKLRKENMSFKERMKELDKLF